METMVRVYYSSPTTRLTRPEAIHYLVTGELPERALLDKASPDQAARYRAASPANQAAWRHAYGEVTVANGQLTVDEDSYPFGRWEPYNDESVELYASDEFGERQIRVRAGGSSRELGTARGHYAALGHAMEIAETAAAVAAAGAAEQAREG